MLWSQHQFVIKLEKYRQLARKKDLMLNIHAKTLLCKKHIPFYIVHGTRERVGLFMENSIEPVCINK